MTKHIGVKLINAFPMTRQAYNDFRGWQLPADENGADEGYLVEYLDGGKPNTDRFDGYVSWSPKEVFEKAYRPVSGLSFGLAIEALKQGKKVARAGWNGKGMWVVVVKPPQTATPPDMRYDVKVGDEYTFVPGVKLLPWIGMKTADGGFVPWLASQTDVLAEDWQIV
ncbi:DUF2829 domain-containing protein [Raoultella ornithinolytica]|uniref:DUF2829 domain-containing protein n=1 Tax=Raoultella ornithinolytica TaxID=54291 RepID=UPI000CF34E2C|nr:DUF2829 domain-containing protein [Raoultella ornithinolytica]PQH12183.1 DUF2829 domain-containing protein [Raoultella ornithinolytica]PQH39302.1 DUF2829 domain-containing protein [Raoultella ornithinolytica]WLP48213.1 DUF2829 domain-containing protein [Raoultella ornithinolytica]HEC2551352.1 DUF2829 domain-containing protein [Raoultella ornithinolytica]HEC2603975.1 DUF2829 domain-containing protein [Raoultella ornithinolytica]